MSESGPTHEFNNLLPEDGPYGTYSRETDSGILLRSVSFERPGLVKYLREHGIILITPMDTANCQIHERTIALHDDTSPFHMALSHIHEEESQGAIPSGSLSKATHALLNGYFEETEWYSYVEKPAGPTDVAE